MNARPVHTICTIDHGQSIYDHVTTQGLAFVCSASSCSIFCHIWYRIHTCIHTCMCTYMHTLKRVHRRHLCEFTGLDIEMAISGHYNETLVGTFALRSPYVRLTFAVLLCCCVAVLLWCQVATCGFICWMLDMFFMVDVSLHACMHRLIPEPLL